ncbi:MAG: CBS domain-containing protein, partial [Dongiaceae bacterium]
MVREVETLPATMLVAEAIAFFTEPDARHKGYPVVDAAGRVTGLVTRADILDWTQNPDLADETLAEMISDASLTVGHPDDLVASLADHMAEVDTGRIPIVDRDTGKLVGLVSRRDLLRARSSVRSAERERGAFLLRGKQTVPVPSELGR